MMAVNLDDHFPKSTRVIFNSKVNIMDCMQLFHVFYGSVMSEFLRMARSTLQYSDFLPVCVSLFKRMINQGGSELKLLNQIKKALNRHFSSFDFSKSASQIIADIRSGQVVGDL